MNGSVTNLHAMLPGVFRLPDGREISIEFVIDTGFTDYLTLPLEAVTLLGLPFGVELPAFLADGSDVLLPAYRAEIVWRGQVKEVNVWATGTRPLLGTALLDGHELVVQFAEGGLVTVDIL